MRRAIAEAIGFGVGLDCFGLGAAAANLIPALIGHWSLRGRAPNPAGLFHHIFTTGPPGDCCFGLRLYVLANGSRIGLPL